MKKQLLIGVLSVLAASVMAADSAKDEVVKAAKKVAGSAYSWKQTTENPGGGGNRQFQPGPTEGKIDKDGTAHITSTRGENTFEYVVKGTKGAVKREGSWVSLTEAAEGGGNSGRGGGRMFSRLAENFRAPAVQAEQLASKAKSVTKSGDAYTAELTEEQVKPLLTFGGRGGANAPEVSGAKGTAKFWLKDGALTKYEYNVKGSVTFGDNEREVNRTTTVELKDVGTTKLTVPEDAKKKIS